MFVSPRTTMNETTLLLRTDDDVRIARAAERQVIKQLCTISTLASTIKALPASPHMSQQVTILHQRCTLAHLASDTPDPIATAIAAARDIGLAALLAVAEAYAYTPCQPTDMDEALGIAVRHLPLWADSQRFNDAFKRLIAVLRCARAERPLDLGVLSATLRALSCACDACHEVLTVASMSGPGGPWDPARQTWSLFGSFTPPDTPELGSPTVNRPGPITTRSVQDTTKLAFESVPGTGHVNCELLPVGLMAALDETDQSQSPSSYSDSEGPGSPTYPAAMFWHAAQKPGGPGFEGYPDEEWAGYRGLYGPRHDKIPLHWKERPTGFRVVMCRHMDAKGKCKKAGTCTFAHSPDDLERFRTLFIPTERCNYGAKCVYRNKNCQYSHTPMEQHRSIKYYNAVVVQACAGLV